MAYLHKRLPSQWGLATSRGHLQELHRMEFMPRFPWLVLPETEPRLSWHTPSWWAGAEGARPVHIAEHSHVSPVLTCTYPSAECQPGDRLLILTHECSQ